MGVTRNLRGAAVSLLLMLAACASVPKNPAPPPAAAPAVPVFDASYDWHGLLLLPFGTVLKDAPFALHEVLMFRDAAHAAQGDDAECYAMEPTPPRFLKQTPSEYLLCYKHDRLARVQATVNLPKADAAQILSDACGLWQRNAGAVQAGAAQAAASGEGAAAQAGSNSCEGREGPVGYSSRLEENTEQADTALTIRLDTLAQP